MLYFLLPYGNICSLIRLFYKISHIFMFRKIVRRCAFTRMRPLEPACFRIEDPITEKKKESLVTKPSLLKESLIIPE